VNGTTTAVRDSGLDRRFIDAADKVARTAEGAWRESPKDATSPIHRLSSVVRTKQQYADFIKHTLMPSDEGAGDDTDVLTRAEHAGSDIAFPFAQIALSAPKAFAARAAGRSHVHQIYAEQV